MGDEPTDDTGERGESTGESMDVVFLPKKAGEGDYFFLFKKETKRKGESGRERACWYFRKERECFSTTKLREEEEKKVSLRGWNWRGQEIVFVGMKHRSQRAGARYSRIRERRLLVTRHTPIQAARPRYPARAVGYGGGFTGVWPEGRHW